MSSKIDPTYEGSRRIQRPLVLPRRHPRADLVEKARIELNRFYLDWSRRHDLTPAEATRTLSKILDGDLEAHLIYERLGKN